MSNNLIKGNLIPYMEWDKIKVGDRVWVENCYTTGEIREAQLTRNLLRLHSLVNRSATCSITYDSYKNLNLRIYELVDPNAPLKEFPAKQVLIKEKMKELIEDMQPEDTQKVNEFISYINEFFNLK